MSIASLTFCATLFAAAPSSAQPLSHDLSTYVLFGIDEFRTKGVHVASGNLGVNNGGLHSGGPIIAPTSQVAADTVQIDDDSECGKLFVNNAVRTGPACAPGDPVTSPIFTTSEILTSCGYPAVFPTCNVDDREVPHGGTLNLAPGTYGNMNVEGGGAGGGGGVLVLQGGGTYTFCSLHLSRNAAITVTGAGVATINIDGGDLELGGGASAANVDLFASGQHAHFSRRSHVAGRLCAPNARLRLTRGTDLIGTFVARVIRTEHLTATLAAGGTTTTTSTSSTTVTSTSSTSTTTLPGNTCGNSALDPSEVCDDGLFAVTAVCGSAGGAFPDQSCRRCTAGCALDCSLCPGATTTTTSTTLPGGSTTSTTLPGGSTTSTTLPGGSTTSTTLPGGSTTSTTLPGGSTTSTTLPGGSTTSTTLPGGSTTSTTLPGGSTTSTTLPGGSTTSTTLPGGSTTSTTLPGGSTTSTTLPGGSTTSTTLPGGSTTSTTLPGGSTTSTTLPGGSTTSTTLPGGSTTTTSTLPGGSTTSTTLPGGSTTSTTLPSSSTTTTSTTTPSSSTTSTTLPGGSCGDAILEGTEICDGNVFAPGAVCGSPGGAFPDQSCRQCIMTGPSACNAIDCSLCPGATTTTTSTSSTTTSTIGGSTSTTSSTATSSTSTSSSSTSTTTTTHAPAVCGNGVREFPEQCDGVDFGGQDCPGSPGGAFTLVCRNNCTIDSSNCPATTTTTLPTQPITPSPKEICGNCLDDDNNGLTDFEDPACCSGTQAFTTVLRRAKIRGLGATSYLRIKSTLASSGLSDVDPMHRGTDVFLQIRNVASGELLCARFPAMKFMRMHGAFKYWADRKHPLPAAKGIDDLALVVKKDGSLRMRTLGKHTQFQSPGPSTLEVTLGLRDPNTAEVSNKCSRVTQAFRAGKRNALVVP